MTEADVFTIVIAAIALLVSLFTLGWQLVRARWEKPIILVEGRIGNVYMQDGLEPKLVSNVTVTNIGDRVITVSEVGWRGLVGASMKPVTVGAGDMSGLPMRLEGRDSKTWSIEIPDGVFDLTREGWPVVKVVRRLTGRERKAGTQPMEELVGKSSSWAPTPESIMRIIRESRGAQTASDGSDDASVGADEKAETGTARSRTSRA